MSRTTLHREQARYFAGANEARFAWQTANSIIGKRELSLLEAALTAWPEEGWVVEIGAGEGANLFHLVRHTTHHHGRGNSLWHQPRCLAIDAVYEKAAFAQRAQPNHVRGLCADAFHLPLRSGCTTLVIIRDLLHHVETPLGILKEVARVLQPGGNLIVIEPNGRNPLMALFAIAQPAERRMLRSTPEWLYNLLKQSGGFSGPMVHGADPFPLTRVVCHYQYGAKRLASSRFGYWLGRCEMRVGSLLPRSWWAYIVVRCRRMPSSLPEPLAPTPHTAAESTDRESAART